jgi:hypothetical protein
MTAPTAATIAARLETCTTCRHRRATTCHLARQLVTVQTRLPAATCPAALWPDSTPDATRDEPPALTAFATGRPPATDPLEAVAVVVLCHNYGHFLPDALASLDRQTLPPAQITLVDDHSTDNTPDLAAAWQQSPAPPGQRRTVVTRRDAKPQQAQATADGYAATTVPLVCVLDADDWLAPDYLEEAARALAMNPLAAIATTDLEQFGDRVGRLQLTPQPIHRANWIHAGAVTRRTAIDQLREPWPADFPADAHLDWQLWRRILANGWTAVKTAAVYHYRRHANSVTAALATNPPPYHHLAQLDREPVTLFCAVSGRPNMPTLTNLRAILPRDGHRLTLWLSLPTHLPAAAAAEYLNLSRLVADFRLTRRPTLEGLAAADRHDPAVRRAVQIEMTRLYARTLRDSAGEYVWILEDDVTPPPDALQTLLAAMDPTTASASLPYRSRYLPAYVAWDSAGRAYDRPPTAGLAEAGGNGWGCVLLRRSYCAALPIRSDRGGDFDPSFYQDLVLNAGGRVVIDWRHPCQHGPDQDPPE